MFYQDYENQLYAAMRKEGEAKKNEARETDEKIDTERLLYSCNRGLVTASSLVPVIERLQAERDESNKRITELEKGLRWACDVYMVADELSGDEREARIQRAISYAINHGSKYWNNKMPKAPGVEGE